MIRPLFYVAALLALAYAALWLVGLLMPPLCCASLFG